MQYAFTYYNYIHIGELVVACSMFRPYSANILPIVLAECTSLRVVKDEARLPSYSDMTSISPGDQYTELYYFLLSYTSS